MKRAFVLAVALAIGCCVHANVRLPKIFGNNMVLQRDTPIKVWGWADARERITVQFDKQTRSVRAGRDGKWEVTLDAVPYGGPYQLDVKGKNAISFTNVLVGDVWVCSGQSNMEWPLASSNNAGEEIRQSDFPQIRHFKVPTQVAAAPLADVSGGSWEISGPETSGDFTAVGYFFARALHRELNIPIGLINTSWGGTHVETWTSREAFEGSEEFKNMIAKMPKLDLDSIARANMTTTRKRIEGLQGRLDAPSETVLTWKEASFDDSSWPAMTVPRLWESQEPGNIDGLVWLRKSFDLSVAEAGKEGILELAKIDDGDETYVNGVKVGTTSRYNEDRRYSVPANILKEGKNVIAIRVEDTGGGGGVYGDPEAVKITAGGKTIPLAGKWLYQVEKLSVAAGLGPNDYPTLLYNAMIHPLLPYAIKGAIWYQGESNAGRSYQYRKAFPLMITDWRKRWKMGDFPFYFVQLASFEAGGGNSRKGSGWAELREAQTLTLSLPNTGMAVTTDIGDPHDIHPRNKQDVGKRLAAIALNKTYGGTEEYSGPVYEAMKTIGNKAVITFTHTGKGLMTPDKYGYLRGFEIAGADRQFHYAKAFIEGDHVVVVNDNVSSPVAVRFGWADDASDCNLYNMEGFPAGPFRTDQWTGITEQNSFRIAE